MHRGATASGANEGDGELHVQAFRVFCVATDTRSQVGLDGLHSWQGLFMHLYFRFAPVTSHVGQKVIMPDRRPQ